MNEPAIKLFMVGWEQSIKQIFEFLDWNYSNPEIGNNKHFPSVNICSVWLPGGWEGRQTVEKIWMIRKGRWCGLPKRQNTKVQNTKNKKQNTKKNKKQNTKYKKHKMCYRRPVDLSLSRGSKYFIFSRKQQDLPNVMSNISIPSWISMSFYPQIISQRKAKT